MIVSVLEEGDECRVPRGGEQRRRDAARHTGLHRCRRRHHQAVAAVSSSSLLLFSLFSPFTFFFFEAAARISSCASRLACFASSTRWLSSMYSMYSTILQIKSTSR